MFNDQYAEYKEIHAEVQVLTQKFDEMDNLMRNLPQQPSSQMVIVILQILTIIILKLLQTFTIIIHCFYELILIE